jgi:hypothetical protein
MFINVSGIRVASIIMVEFLLYPEDGGCKFLRNTDNDVLGCMTQHLLEGE